MQQLACIALVAEIKMLIPLSFMLLLLYAKSGSCGECEVTRIAKNSGFHRNVVTEVKLIGVSTAPLSCKILLIELLPTGMYVDIYEIKNIGNLQVYSAVKFDIEKPEHSSPPHELYVWQNFTMNTSLSTAVQVTLPVHLRYHKASATGKQVKVTLERPRIFAQCEGSDFIFQRIEGTSAFSPCGASNLSNLCEWRELSCNFKNETTLDFFVPVGNLEHVQLVVAGTLLCTIGATLLLLYFICWRVNVTSSLDKKSVLQIANVSLLNKSQEAEQEDLQSQEHLNQEISTNVKLANSKRSGDKSPIKNGTKISLRKRNENSKTKLYTKI